MRSTETRARVRALAERERARQAPRFGPRARAFLDQKVEGVLEAPVGLVRRAACRRPRATEVLGRATIPATDLYSTACAIQNLWLTARAEGLGVGWVSFYRPDELRAVLGIPDGGRAGGVAVRRLARRAPGAPRPRARRLGAAPAAGRRRPSRALAAGEAQPTPAPMPDAGARIAARDRADLLVKPAGSLGALEDVVERWSAATGAPPPAPLRAAHLVCAADHGHAARGTSLFDGAVSGQVAAAAARGETAIGVLARAREETLVVADVGLRGADAPRAASRAAAPTARPTSSRAPPWAPTSATRRWPPAASWRARCCAERRGLPRPRRDRDRQHGHRRGPAVRADRRATATRWSGRGTGLDAQGVARKARTVAAALAADRHAPDVDEALRQLGGLELAALAGAIHAAHDARTPVVLDGLAVGVAALVAVRLRPDLPASGSSPATARPSRPTRSCSPSSGSSRCSTCACGWARPAAPRSRCR